MPAWICRTCAVQQPDTPQPPGQCPICDDERQYVGWAGQQWTTMAEIARDHAVEVREEEPGLTGIGVQSAVGIGQRALLVRTPDGNVLWDCVPLLDEAARARITELGGIDAICMSHPHFYAAHVDFADAFDARVLIPGPTSSGSSGPHRASSCSATTPSRCPASRWPGSAVTSTARPSCTGRPGPAAAASC